MDLTQLQAIHVVLHFTSVPQTTTPFLSTDHSSMCCPGCGIRLANVNVHVR
jgi:hypothetical protein